MEQNKSSSRSFARTTSWEKAGSKRHGEGMFFQRSFYLLHLEACLAYSARPMGEEFDYNIFQHELCLSTFRSHAIQTSPACSGGLVG